MSIPFDVMASSLANMFTLSMLPYLMGGVLLGLMVGVLPALGGTAGLSLLVPFVFGMEPNQALAMMTGLLATVNTGDTLTSVLMGVPGSAASQATILDGFPLAKKGQAARALSAAYLASMIGGLFGALMLSMAIVVARPVILAFGTGEMLLLVLLGITMVCVLSGASLVKGLLACGVGMLLGAVGSAPATGEYRMVLNIDYLYDGLPLPVVALGVFALPEIVDLLRRGKAISERMELGTGWGQGARECLQNVGLILRTSGMGCLIGALPGIGGSVVDWIAYGHTVQSARDKSQFGKGDIRGVIGVEGSNNAVQGGALIPTLIFGIPGSGSTAIYLGGIIVIGLQPGMAMVEQNLDTVYTVIWSLAIANVLGAGIMYAISGQTAKLTTIPYVYLAPFMLTIVFYASFQSGGRTENLVALILAGVLGVYLRRFGYSRPAFLIGFVLQNNIESFLYQTIQFYTIQTLLSRWLIWVLIALVVVSLAAGLKFRPNYSTEGESTHGQEHKVGPQLAFLLAITGFAAFYLFDVHDKMMLGAVFPASAAGTVLVLALFALWRFLRMDPNDAIVFDAEVGWRQREEGYQASLQHYIWWMLGFLAMVLLFGFMIALVAFFLAFLRAKSTASWSSIGIMTASMAAVMMLISHVMVLYLPGGLLQQWVDLPWPFN
ncbi:MAG: tripartite tricarboxylate transporter permease [Alphaproteobacteria bacterium]|nr:tripartite tricarboxylate transporter permease [Alphaproteobacteria bacterium]